MDFCKSGHISESDILKMKQTKGEYKLPNHIISRVFLRGNRLYYSDEESRIKNVFHSNPSDDLPDPFVRVAILKWLFERKRIKGPSGIIGFHKAEELINTMIRFGHSYDRVYDQLLSLLKYSLIISESQNTEKLEKNELISINPPGIIHFELIKNIDYLSTCSEDVWYSKEKIAEYISKNMSGQGRFSHLSIQNSIEHSEILINYLENYFNENFKAHSEYLSDTNNNTPIKFDNLKSDIDNFKVKLINNPIIELEQGSRHKGSIINIMNYGLICSIEGSEQVGLVYKDELEDDFDSIYLIGDEIEFEIIVYKPEHNKYNLRLVK